MAGTTGLEPAASAVTGQRSNQLNYVPTREINEMCNLQCLCGIARFAYRAWNCLGCPKERDSCPNRPETATKFELFPALLRCAKPPAQNAPRDPDCCQSGNRQQKLRTGLALKYPNSFSLNTEERRGSVRLVGKPDLTGLRQACPSSAQNRGQATRSLSTSRLVRTNRARIPKQWKPQLIGKEALDRFLELRGLIEHHHMRRGAYPNIGDLLNGCILLAKKWIGTLLERISVVPRVDDCHLRVDRSQFWARVGSQVLIQCLCRDPGIGSHRPLLHFGAVLGI